MAVDQVQSPKNQELFKERRNRQWLVTVPMVVLVIGAMWFRDHPGQALMGVGANVFFPIFLAALALVTISRFAIGIVRLAMDIWEKRSARSSVPSAGLSWLGNQELE